MSETNVKEEPKCPQCWFNKNGKCFLNFENRIKCLGSKFSLFKEK